MKRVEEDIRPFFRKLGAWTFDLREKTSFSCSGRYICFGDSGIYAHTEITPLVLARQNTHARTLKHERLEPFRSLHPQLYPI